MSFESATRQFSFYTEDEALLGTRIITLSAYLDDYPEITLDTPVTADIVIDNEPQTKFEPPPYCPDFSGINAKVRKKETSMYEALNMSNVLFGDMPADLSDETYTEQIYN